MTTITIDKRLLEKLYLYWLEDADPDELEDFKDEIRTALASSENDATNQIAEELRQIGLTLVRTGTSYKVLKLGAITAQEDKS